jgi:serpin B
VAQSSDAFALDLYGRARVAKGNLALSPFSVFTALAMTAAGARGETLTQMRKVLHLAGASDPILDATGGLVSAYRAPGTKFTLRIVNRLFGEKGAAFEPPYLSRVKAVFGAPLEPVDFVKDAELVRGRINASVARETEDRIKDLIPPKGVDADTRLVLTNAIYFLGEWATAFETAKTAPAPFSSSATETKPVPTMHLTESVRYAATAGVKLVELPYQGGTLAMTFVLPDAVDGLDGVEAKLSPEMLAAFGKSLETTRVAVSLPKFEIDPSASLSLGAILVAMGMQNAFDRAKADFAGIANPPSPEDKLLLARVFHKAYLRVDEKGTEAAAGSAAVVARKGGGMPVEFKADHPFLFLLRDTRWGMILFVGRVTDPSVRG